VLAHPQQNWTKVLRESTVDTDIHTWVYWVSPFSTIIRSSANSEDNLMEIIVDTQNGTGSHINYGITANIHHGP